MAKEKSSMNTSNSSSQFNQEAASHAYKLSRTRLQKLQAENGPAVAAAGEKRLPEFGGPKDINECAEDFIKQFRQNLQLQRLQSIENYREMLARGL